MKRRPVILPALAISFVVLFAFVPAALADTLTIDFEGGVPAEVTLALGPVSCTPDSEVQGPMGIASAGAHGNGLHEGQANPAEGDTGQAMIVFPELVNIATINANIYDPFSTGEVGGAMVACDADGDPITSVGHFGGAYTLGLSSVNNVAAIVFETWECQENSPGQCANMIPEGKDAFRSYLDDISIAYTLTGTPFDPGVYGGSGAGLFKPISGLDLVHISDDQKQIETRPNANVHSVSAGKIINMSPSTATGFWHVAVQPLFTTSLTDVLDYYNLQSINGAVGDTVSAGCVLGLAANAFMEGAEPGSGGIIFDADETTQEEWPDYADSPNDRPCDAEQYLTEHCLNLNPNFADNAKDWNRTFGVTSEPGVVILQPGSSIYQDIPDLDTGTPYYVTVYAAAPYVPAQIGVDISIGGAESHLTIAPSQSGEYVKVVSQALTLTGPDFDPNLFRLIIKYPPSPANTTLPPLRVRFACVADQEAAVAPGACYFEDPDLRTDEWTGTGATSYDSPQELSGTSGRYVVPADEMIFRDVSISAFLDADTDYRLLTKSKGGTGTPLIGPYGRWHAYIRDSDTEELIVDIGEWDLLPVIPTIRVMPFTLTSGTAVTGDLVIENVSDDIDDPGWTQEIYQICLQVEGGVWPGYDNSDTSVLFNQDCTLCTPPGDLGDITVENLLGWVVQWLAFGWCYLGYILNCLIFGLLNKVWMTIISFMAGVALFGKWVGMVVSAVAMWARDGFRFGFNNLIAALLPIANAIIGWLLNMPLVQGLLDALGIVGIWLDGLFRLINDVIALLLLGLQFIGALLNLISEIWAAFLAALSAAPSGDFPFPDCTNPSSPLYDACIPLDVVNWLTPKFPALILLINVAAFSVFWRQFRILVRAVREDIFTTS